MMGIYNLCNKHLDEKDHLEDSGWTVKLTDKSECDACKRVRRRNAR